MKSAYQKEKEKKGESFHTTKVNKTAEENLFGCFVYGFVPLPTKGTKAELYFTYLETEQELKSEQLFPTELESNKGLQNLQSIPSPIF